MRRKKNKQMEGQMSIFDMFSSVIMMILLMMIISSSMITNQRDQRLRMISSMNGVKEI